MQRTSMSCVGPAVFAGLLATVFAGAALASDRCPPPNAPPDAPGGSGPGLNPTPGGGGGPVTTGGGGGGPTTPGTGYLPGRRGDRIPALPGATTEAETGRTGWTRWWERNRDVHLRFRPLRRDVAVTPSGAAPPASTAPPAAGGPECVGLLRDDLLPFFLQAAQDDDASLRLTAVMALGRSGGGDDVSRVLRTHIRTDRHPAVREASLLALGLLGRQPDLPYLQEFLADRRNDARSRSFAALAIGLVGGDAAADVLRGFVGGSRRIGANREDLDCAAVLALGLTKSATASDALRALLADDRYRDSVRAAAFTSLGRLGDRGLLPLGVEAVARGRETELRSSAAQALGAVATPADDGVVDVLVEAARRDGSPAVRHFALISLGRVGGPGTADRLQVLFRNAKGDDRAFAAIALGLTQEAHVLPLLRDALADERSEVDRSALCLALGLLGRADAVPLLSAQLAGRSTHWHDAYSATSLALLGARDAAPEIRNRLVRCKDRDVRRHLTVALGILGDDAGALDLRARLDARADSDDRSAAAMAAGVLRVASLVPRLVEIARDRREPFLVRAAALSALARMADPDPVPELARVVANDDYTLGLETVDRVWQLLERR